MIDPVLGATLERVATLLRDARWPWWVIGSAAVALHGTGVAVRRDVDVLVDPGDMPMLAAATGHAPRPGVADERFRSAQVLRLTEGALAIDLIADLRIRGTDDLWARLQPHSRVPIEVGACRVYIPAAMELIAILLRFGRPKDVERADLLSAIAG